MASVSIQACKIQSKLLWEVLRSLVLESGGDSQLSVCVMLI